MLLPGYRQGCWHANRNTEVRYGLSYDSARADHTMLADIGHHNGPLANPGPATDRDWREHARLHSDWNVCPQGSMLARARK